MLLLQKLGTYIINSTDTIKVRHSEDHRSNLFVEKLR